MGADQITVPDFDYEATDNDRMRVNATVRNDADANQDVTLAVQVEIDGESHEESTDLTVRANESADAAVVVDADVEAFEEGGSLQFDWEAEPE